MLFSSMVFLWLFLPITVIGAIFLKTKYQNLALLAASLFFYAWGEPVYVFLMVFSIIVNWSFGLLIGNKERQKHFFLILCIAVNLGILGYFKYFNFFVDIFNGIFNAEVLSFRDIVLPIGISFFTFQELSYVIDVYRGKCAAQRNILKLALFISFFPQLIAGPIIRYHDIYEQIESRKITLDKFTYGLRRFLYGLAKKVIVANGMAQGADAIFALPLTQLPTGIAWLGAILYTLQIYYDFSGYSDMAIGLGRMFGFTFPENFNYPYLSRSVREFWQRWHISLGNWFKEYLYFPLGGNRKGKYRTYLNLIIVFFLTGLWHGASWSFVVWGLYQGIFQIIERCGLSKILDRFKILSHLYCTLVFIIGWVIFRAETLGYGLRYIAHMLMPWRYFDVISFPAFSLISPETLFILALAILGCGPLQAILQKNPSLIKKWRFSRLEFIFILFIGSYSILLLVTGTYNPFIYFRF